MSSFDPGVAPKMRRATLPEHRKHHPF